jgi:hypothetical protein
MPEAGQVTRVQIRNHRMAIRAVAAMAVMVALSGCAGMGTTLQRALPGSAASPAAMGAIGGDEGLGATPANAAGLAGGLIIDTVKKDEMAAYQRGLADAKHPVTDNKPPVTDSKRPVIPKPATRSAHSKKDRGDGQV